MTSYREVRDALCNLRDQPSGTMGINGKRLLTDWAAYAIAPIIVRALRAEKKAGYMIGWGDANDGGLSEEQGLAWAKRYAAGPLTAGVAALADSGTLNEEAKIDKNLERLKEATLRTGEVDHSIRINATADAPLKPTDEMVTTLRRILDYAAAGHRNHASMELALDGIYKAADDALVLAAAQPDAQKERA